MRMLRPIAENPIVDRQIEELQFAEIFLRKNVFADFCLGLGWHSNYLF
jgi:hypothetical protein